MSAIDRTCAALAALLQPLTGARARFTGVVVGPPAGIVVPKNTYAVPIVDGVERFDLLLKTAAEVTATDEGIEVEFISNVGGRQHDELRIDQPVRLLSAPAELNEFGILTELLIPATDGPEAGFTLNCATPSALACVTIYEGHGTQIDQDFFRGRVVDFPAVVIAWDGSELGDANTQGSMDYGNARVGQFTFLNTERFTLTVFSKRLESHGVRRGELLNVLGDVSKCINQRRSVDGQVFSSPAGLVIHERLPLKVHSSAEFQGVYAATLRVSIQQSSDMHETREFSPWVRTRVDAFFPVDNLPTDPNPLPVVTDSEFLMLSDDFDGFILEEDNQTTIDEEDAVTPIEDA